MLFNSYIFILLFLPIAAVGYFFINRTGKYRIASCFLILMSLVFYGYQTPKYLLIICSSVIINYALSRCMLKADGKTVRKALLVLGVTLNIASIFYFKYYDFFADNVNSLFSSNIALRNIALPLGISFFTFQQVSYLADSYRGETGDYGFIEYALFVVYFPQLVAGPIVLHNEIIPQFRDEQKRRANPENIAHGVYIFAMGLFKKVLIADTFGLAVNWGYTNIAGLSSLDAFLVSLFYTFQLYFDFSGYCDMAIGIGYIFNIRLPQNFNSPYKATSVIDFWGRWHMSLTRFLRQYVYYPLGGSRKGTVSTYLNVLIVFAVSGLWHGANWTFVIWGVLYGVLNCLNRAFRKPWDKVPSFIRWCFTFLTVDLMWVLFRSESISQAGTLLKKMVHPLTFSISSGLRNGFLLPEFITVRWFVEKIGINTDGTSVVFMWLFLIVSFLLTRYCKNNGEIEFKPTVKRGILAAIALVWSIMSLSGVTEFLYFNF